MFNSVSEAAKAGKSLKLYPNPARDIVNIEMDYNKDKTITIFDITGKVVETVKNSDELTTINVANYNKGFYMYEVRTTAGELIKSGKFNIAH
jgi:mannose/fructose/N-acetylgalactosamine-specific phosphotransferase system component IIB